MQENKMKNDMINLSYSKLEQDFNNYLDNSEYIYLGCSVGATGIDKEQYRFYDDKYIVTHYFIMNKELYEFCMITGYDGIEYVCIDYFWSILTSDVAIKNKTAIDKVVISDTEITHTEIAHSENEQLDYHRQYSGQLRYYIKKHPKKEIFAIKQYYKLISAKYPQKYVPDMKEVDKKDFKLMLCRWLEKEEHL